MVILYESRRQIYCVCEQRWRTLIQKKFISLKIIIYFTQFGIVHCTIFY